MGRRQTGDIWDDEEPWSLHFHFAKEEGYNENVDDYQ